MPVPVIIILSMLAAIFGMVVLVAVIPPVFRGIGWFFRGLFWLIAHISKFIFNTIADALRIVGAVITAIVLIPFVLLNIVIARWSAAAHFGRSMQREITAAGAAGYRLVIGNPARLLLLNAITEGIEQRIPEAIAQAPGADRPSKATGAFPGYKVVGSLRAGGSGGRLFVAEPLPEKRAALARSGAPSVDQVVIKAFSVKEGATLDQIVRESRALEAARRLHLILDHELTSERFYYVTPYVPGENLSLVTQHLHARAGDGGLRGDTLRHALDYTRDLLRTLDRYHGAGLWHKDIKPDNIIVHAGSAHLVDLGLVTPLASAMTLTTHGTEYFRDPEMVRMALRGVKVHEVDGVKFDVYGVGAVLYSVIENSFPAHGGLSQISKACPETLRWVIRRSMTDLAHRYPSARAMLADIEHIAGASDPFALKPADLPSMREGEPAMPEPEPDPEFAAIPAAYAGRRAGAPNPGAAHAAPAPVAEPHAPGASRVRIRVLDWWTGRYDAESAAARAHAPAPRPTPRPRAADAPFILKVDGPRIARGRSAKDQLASARSRVARRRQMARARLPRHARFEAGPNFGVGVAVLIFLGIIGLVIAKAVRTEAPVAAAPAANPGDLQLALHVLAPTGSWSIDAWGDDDMLLIDEDEPIMRASIVGPDDDSEELAAAPAAFFPRLLAGPLGTGRVAVLWDRATLNGDSVATLHAIADLLEDGGATLVGYDDRAADIDAAARMRSIIGVSGPSDPEVLSALTTWMVGEQLSSMLIVEREGAWTVIDPTGKNLHDAMFNAEALPPPPIVPASRTPAGIAG